MRNFASRDFLEGVVSGRIDADTQLTYGMALQVLTEYFLGLEHEERIVKDAGCISASTIMNILDSCSDKYRKDKQLYARYLRRFNGIAAPRCASDEGEAEESHD